MFAGLFAQAFSLGANHKHGGFGKFFCREGVCPIHSQAVYPKALFFEHAECLIYIAYRHKGNRKSGASRSFYHGARERSLIVFGDEYCRSTKCRCRANNRSHVLWIGELSQYDDTGVGSGGLYAIERVEPLE